MRQPDRLLTDFLLHLCSPRINAWISSSMLQQKTLGSLPCHPLVWTPMNPIDLSPSKHNPRLLAWSQIQTKQETPANPRATSLKPANGLKFNLYLSYPSLGSNKPRSIPSSVSGSLLWSPFPLWPHYQEITKNISSTFFLSIHPSISDSKISNLSLWTHSLSPARKQTTHRHQTLQNFME